ncbi:YciI family protein [Roseobacter sp. EG26]|uniref:YciI family protein n=1 Tax=Roseobacter sp. EG26 TaxID=3412477 RepID=UPI003CE4E490
MMYAIAIYGEAGVFETLSEDKKKEVLAGHAALQEALAERGEFLSIKLMPTSTAVTLEPPAATGQAPLIVDGPFAETKEGFLGFYAAEFADLKEALRFAEMISSPIARLEIRPIAWAGGVISTEG